MKAMDGEQAQEQLKLALDELEVLQHNKELLADTPKAEPLY